MKNSLNTVMLRPLFAVTVVLACTNPLLAGDQDWTYSYNANGQVLSANGPRVDVNDLTQYSYDVAGNRTKVTSALGHTVFMQNYNKRGQAGLVRDVNGVETVLVYHRRGWLLSSTVKDPGGSASHDASTHYTYDNEGQLRSTTLPNGTVLSNEYDAAHRLIAVSNNSGERIDYVLDSAGNRLEEITGTASLGITKSLTMAYDELNRLILLTGAGGQTTSYTYDSNGNRVSTTDGNTNTAVQNHDALDRLASALAPLNHSVSYLNDEQGNLVQVTDPKGLVTAYNYDGLNNLVQLTSPDTGITNYTYDQANNRLSQTDANGVSATFSYDALNRVTSTSYPNSNLDIIYSYDEGSYGKGRLTSVTDTSGTTLLEYDHRGNVIYRGLDIGDSSFGVSYLYNTSDQLIQLTYPSGRVVDYTRGSKGLITSASTTTASGNQVLASNADYLPFGPMTALNYGNGIQQSGIYDLDYRLTTLTHAGIRDRQYGYDNADNIIAINDNLGGGADQVFAYDALNRLGTATGAYGNLSYTYDENGNRLSYTSSNGVDTYTYDANSHRLLGTNNWTYEYDSNGNQTAKLNSGDGLLYIYDDHNRMVEVINRNTVVSGKGGKKVSEQIDTSLAKYTYNARGQRARKITLRQTMYYVYGQSGLLLAEVDDSGATHREYIYLNGQPLAAAHYTFDQDPETSGAETIMDDGGPGTGSTGSWVNTRKKGAYNNYYSLSNNTGNTYRFTPSGLNNARYEVYGWWPRTNKNNKTAQFTIAHNGQTSTTVHNQSTSGKQWILLGIYRFSGDGSEYIELSDLGGKTAADGIRLIEKIPAPPPTITTELYYIHNDHLGTPQVFTNQSQAVVWSANYKPFGEVAVSIGSIVNNLRFPGQYFDEESGLHQNYFRDYDP
ncbi:MAG: RHS repeat protein, partial [Proteobacteria bacterium]|nr:RHS repeat protein [Pseudomonadota bacterium]